MARHPKSPHVRGLYFCTNLGYRQELAAYWRDAFDWRAQEAAMNRFAHFRAEVDGVGLHGIHQRGQGPDPLPLLLTATSAAA